jgi:hypothetical protein
MKHIKIYETFVKNDKDFDSDFNIGEVVICVDDSSSHNILKIMKKYIIVGLTGEKIKFMEYRGSKWWLKYRFIKEKDLEKWEIKNNINKYNL